MQVHAVYDHADSLVPRRCVRAGAWSGVSACGVYDRADSLVPISRFLVSFTSTRDHSLFNVIVVADQAEEEEE